ncbi:MAG: hypothetical protein HQ504_07855, partial [Rhodospirillaceae bacterium]|nr:hypothetical protein [Rhodospirillaceae bacterium]
MLSAALMVLSGCAFNGGSEFFAGGCTEETRQHLSGVDWTGARENYLRIRQGEFDPAYIGMFQGRANILIIENRDDESRVFRAIEFFNAIALEGVIDENGNLDDDNCIDAVALGPHETKKLRFVAVRDGVYEFQDNSLLLSMALIGSAGGFITVERPRNIPESPLKHLDLFNRATLTVDQQPEPPRGGLFDDEPGQAPATPQSEGLFDDQTEDPPAQPEGLFDDQTDSPEQPIEAAPTSSVEQEEPLEDETVDKAPGEEMPAFELPDLPLSEPEFEPEPEPAPETTVMTEPAEPVMEMPEPELEMMPEPSFESLPDEPMLEPV